MSNAIIIEGLNQLNGNLLGLTKRERKELNKTGGQFLKNVLKSARIRAPKDTGRLKRDITLVKKRNTQTLSFNSREAVYQEEGFRPHWVYIKDSVKLKPGFYFVRKNKPFLKPALEKNLSKLSQNLNKSINKSIK